MAQVVRPRTRAIVSSLVGFMAMWAYAGAIGLISGAVDLGPAANHRLPLHSPVFAGIALAMVLAIPMTVAFWYAARAPAQTATFSGCLIICWTAAEVAMIHVFNGLQAICLVYGICLIALGISLFNRKGLS